jgi:hypothetical protein
MRPTNINELKRLLAEATQGTWEAHADMSPNGKHRRAWITADGKRVADTASCNLHRPHDRYPQDAKNAALIVAAVNSLPALLADLEEVIRDRNEWSDSTRGANKRMREAEERVKAILCDLEAAQKREQVLREALQAVSQKHPGYGGIGDIARKALAATEAR